mgnify:FL=1
MCMANFSRYRSNQTMAYFRIVYFVRLNHSIESLPLPIKSQQVFKGRWVNQTKPEPTFRLIRGAGGEVGGGTWTLRGKATNTPLSHLQHTSCFFACCLLHLSLSLLTQVINRTLILTRVSYHLVSFVWFVGLFLIWESVVDLRGSRTSKQQP